MTVPAGSMAEAASLERAGRIASRREAAPASPALDVEPGIALLAGGRLNPTIATAPAEARAAHLAHLATLVADRHARGSPVGDALQRARWIDASPPGAWLPSVEGSARALRASRALDRAALATIATELLGGPDCPPGPASLLRRTARAPGAAPLPQEWVIAIRRAFPGLPDPTWGRSANPVVPTAVPRLVLLVLDSGPLSTSRAGWAVGGPGPADLVIALAGAHGERLVLPLQPAGCAALSLADVDRPPLEPGPDLIDNLRAHAIEAAAILDADGIAVDVAEVMVLGSPPGVRHDAAALTDVVERVVVTEG